MILLQNVIWLLSVYFNVKLSKICGTSLIYETYFNQKISLATYNFTLILIIYFMSYQLWKYFSKSIKILNKHKVLNWSVFLLWIYNTYSLVLYVSTNTINMSAFRFMLLYFGLLGVYEKECEETHLH